MRYWRIGLAVSLLSCLAASQAPAAGAAWFVPFERIMVPPVARDDTTQLIDAGTIDTDGFTELRFTVGGEFKEGIPQSGTIGAILVPDLEPFVTLFNTEGRILAELEAKVSVNGTDRIFVSKEASATVAFPRYRVFLYNETGSGASVWFWVYRSRCG